VSGDSPVEDYLDQLLVEAPGPPREVRTLLAEAEGHLWDATADGLARGLGQRQAEEEAVARFGSVRRVTTAEARRQTVALGALARQVVTSGLYLGGLAGVAVGVSGLLTWLLGAAAGPTFIVDISHHTYLAPSDCASWLAGDPSAHSCYQAALTDWSGDVVLFRLVAGVLGLLALGAYLVIRRQRHFDDLPSPMVDTIAVTAFGAAGAVLLGLGVDWMLLGKNGAGQWLSTAPVALALALWFGWRLVSSLRRAPMERLATAT
jgi:hypothetical protein